jgi:hypothetical protein
VANDASNQLLVSYSADGVTWKPNTPVQNQSSKAALGWRCSKTSCGSRSSRTTRAISCSFPLRRRRYLSGSKQVTARRVRRRHSGGVGEQLWIAFVANDASNQLLVSHSADGVTWSGSKQVTTQSSKAAPALVVFESKLWVAFVANDASNQLLVAHSAHGKNWSPSIEVKNQSSKAAPAFLGLAGAL